MKDVGVVLPKLLSLSVIMSKVGESQLRDTPPPQSLTGLLKAGKGQQEEGRRLKCDARCGVM